MSTVDIVNMAGVVVAIALGVYNLVDSHRKDKRERVEKEQARQQEEAEWQLFNFVAAAANEGQTYRPPPGSDELRIAERLVERGRLERLPGGYYSAPGQKPPKRLTFA